MKLKKGMYLLDPTDGEIILLLKKILPDTLIGEEEVEQWEVKIIKKMPKYCPHPYRKRNKALYFIYKKNWKLLTKIDLILLGIKNES